MREQGQDSQDVDKALKAQTPMVQQYLRIEAIGDEA
jgi:hypothetical protein